MKHTTFLLVVLSLLLSAACKKESQPIRDKLIGTWNQTKLAHDDNENGHMDDDEIYNNPNPNKKALVFNQDGTAIMRFTDTQGGVHVYDCTWTVTAEDSLIVVLNNGSGVERTHIDDVTSSQLVLQYSVDRWTIYTK